MPEMEVEFEVLCECGAGLCGNTRVSHGRRMPQVVVEPCGQCLERKYEEGKAEGKDIGYDRALQKYGEEV